jgi:hypothetical protein
MTKPLGFTTFKPFMVKYSINQIEFKELVDKYFKEYIKIELETEVTVIPNPNTKSTDKYIGQLVFVDIENIPDQSYHSLLAHGINDETEPSRNFDIMMDILFAQPEWYVIDKSSDEGEWHMFIHCMFGDYITFKGPTAERESL